MSFSLAVTEIIHVDDANQPPEWVVQVLREAMVLMPDPHERLFRGSTFSAERFHRSIIFPDYSTSSLLPVLHSNGIFPSARSVFR